MVTTHMNLRTIGLFSQFAFLLCNLCKQRNEMIACFFPPLRESLLLIITYNNYFPTWNILDVQGDGYPYFSLLGWDTIFDSLVDRYQCLWGIYCLKVAINISSLACALDRFWGLVIRVPGYRSKGPGFDSQHYQICWAIVDLKRGSLSLVSTTEELLGRNNSGSGLEIREYGRRDPSP
jgi:hypothetical protein